MTKFRIIAQLLDVLPQNFHAQENERYIWWDDASLESVSRVLRDPICPGFGQQLGDALPHLAGGLVGEGDGEDVARRNARARRCARCGK